MPPHSTSSLRHALYPSFMPPDPVQGLDAAAGSLSRVGGGEEDPVEHLLLGCLPS
jgi:hypothetical protein